MDENKKKAEFDDSKKKKLDGILNNPDLKKHQAYVFSSHYDPDSIGCVWLLKLLLEPFVKYVEICFPGKPDDNFQQNGLIVKKFGLDIHIRQINDSLMKKIQPGDLVVFADTPTYDDARFSPVKMVKPHILIDHHARPENMIEDENSWFWYGECGACVSMVTELMIYLDSFKNITGEELERASTLGILGILGDTRKLRSQHTKSTDYQMAAFLSQYAVQKKICEVSFSEYNKTFLDALGIPRDRWTEVGSTLVFRTEGSEDNMVKAADLFMAFEEWHTVIVWNIFKDHILIKARNSNVELKLNTELKRMFGERNSGAKDNASGGAVIPIGSGPFGPIHDEKILIELSKQHLYHSVFGLNAK